MFLLNWVNASKCSLTKIKWISGFKQIIWLNDSIFDWMIQWLNYLLKKAITVRMIKNEFTKTVTCFILEWISVLNKSFDWMIQWFSHRDNYISSWMNRLSEWFKNSFRKTVTWFIPELIGVLNKSFDRMTCSKSQLLSEWFKNSFTKTVACFIPEQISVLNKLFGWMMTHS